MPGQRPKAVFKALEIILRQSLSRIKAAFCAFLRALLLLYL